MRNTAPNPKRRRRRTVAVVAPVAQPSVIVPFPEDSFGRKKCKAPSCPYGNRMFRARGNERGCSPECKEELRQLREERANRTSPSRQPAYQRARYVPKPQVLKPCKQSGCDEKFRGNRFDYCPKHRTKKERSKRSWSKQAPKHKAQGRKLT